MHRIRFALTVFYQKIPELCTESASFVLNRWGRSLKGASHNGKNSNNTEQINGVFETSAEITLWII